MTRYNPIDLSLGFSVFVPLALPVTGFLHLSHFWRVFPVSCSAIVGVCGESESVCVLFERRPLFVSCLSGGGWIFSRSSPPCWFTLWGRVLLWPSPPYWSGRSLWIFWMVQAQVRSLSVENTFEEVFSFFSSVDSLPSDLVGTGCSSSVSESHEPG